MGLPRVPPADPVLTLRVVPVALFVKVTVTLLPVTLTGNPGSPVPLSVPIRRALGPGVGMRKPPVTGLRRLSRLSATGLISDGNRFKPGLSWLTAAAIRAAERSLPTSARNCGRTVMLLAVGTKAVLACVRW